MAKLSRDKGKRGELEVVALLKKHGFEARRGQQYEGASDSPDVMHNVTGLYIEVKRREAFNLHAAWLKAEEERRLGQRSAIFHKKNHQPWFVTMEAHAFLSIMRELEENCDGG